MLRRITFCSCVDKIWLTHREEHGDEPCILPEWHSGKACNVIGFLAKYIVMEFYDRLWSGLIHETWLKSPQQKHNRYYESIEELSTISWQRNPDLVIEIITKVLQWVSKNSIAEGLKLELQWCWRPWRKLHIDGKPSSAFWSSELC